MRIPVPQKLCEQISAQAVKYAREEINGWGWSENAIQALQPMIQGNGWVGIQSTLKYLMLQERGVNHPWLLWGVEGKTIGMACKMGDGPHFRRGGHVGEAGWVDIPHVGKVWRDQRWLHPGLKARNFMHNGIRKAVAEAQPQLEAYAKSLFGGIAE